MNNTTRTIIESIPATLAILSFVAIAVFLGMIAVDKQQVVDCYTAQDYANKYTLYEVPENLVEFCKEKGIQF